MIFFRSILDFCSSPAFSLRVIMRIGWRIEDVRIDPGVGDDERWLNAERAKPPRRVLSIRFELKALPCFGE